MQFNDLIARKFHKWRMLNPTGSSFDLQFRLAISISMRGGVFFNEVHFSHSYGDITGSIGREKYA